jgi:hypothetical protein
MVNYARGFKEEDLNFNPKRQEPERPSSSTAGYGIPE